MFLNQFAYKIVHKKGRHHLNADRLSRRVYDEPAPAPKVNFSLEDDNFVTAVDFGMDGNEFSEWMEQLEKDSSEIDSELGDNILNYNAQMDAAVGAHPFTHVTEHKSFLIPQFQLDTSRESIWETSEIAQVSVDVPSNLKTMGEQTSLTTLGERHP